jgi:uncharacterized protein (UPF0335 family)
MMANALKHGRHEMAAQSIIKIESEIAINERATRPREFGLSRTPEDIPARAMHLMAIMESLRGLADVMEREGAAGEELQ